MKFLTAFAILASAVSAAPHIVQLEMRDDCVGKRYAVFAIDNSNTVDKKDPENVRYEVPRKVLERLSPEADKGAVLISTWGDENRVAAQLGAVNDLHWDTPAGGRGGIKADELVVAATTHIKNNVPAEHKGHTAIILLTGGFDVLDGGPGWHVYSAFGTKAARAIHDAAYEGIRVHFGHLNANHQNRDVSFYNTASRDSGGWFSEINSAAEVGVFVDQLFKKGLTNKDEECRGKPQPEPSKEPEPSKTPEPTQEPSKTPEPTQEPSKTPEPTQEPEPTSNCPAPTVSTVTEKVTETVKETVKETVTAPAPTATGNVCFAPCDAPGAKPLTGVKIEL